MYVCTYLNITSWMSVNTIPTLCKKTRTKFWGSDPDCWFDFTAGENFRCVLAVNIGLGEESIKNGDLWM